MRWPGRRCLPKGRMVLFAVPPGVRRYIVILSGFAILSLGIYLKYWAGLGTGAWTVFHVGLALHLPLTIGQVTIVMGALLLGLGTLLKVPPRIGTIMNMVFIGLFFDLWDWLALFPEPQHLVTQFTYFFCGLALLSLGAGTYLTAGLGAGPRDSVMLGLNKRFGLSIRLARTLMEVAVLLLGFLLGGPVGVGTIIASLSIGPAIQFWMQYLGQLLQPFLNAAPQAPSR